MTKRMGVLTTGAKGVRVSPLERRAELRPAVRKLAAVAVGFAGGWAGLYGALMPLGLGCVLGFGGDCFAACAAGAAEPPWPCAGWEQKSLPPLCWQDAEH